MVKEFKKEKRLYYNNEELIEYDLPHCLDFFVWLGRTGVKSEYELTKKFELAFAESPNIAVRMMFFLRNYKCDKESFRLLLKHLAINHPQNVGSKVLKFIPIYGNVDELMILLDTPVEKKLRKFLRKRLFRDQNALQTVNYELSNIAYWLPTPESEVIEDRENAKKIAKLLNMDLRGYKHMIQRMRDKILRQTNRGKNFISLDYSRIPKSENNKFWVCPWTNIFWTNGLDIQNFYKRTALPPNKTTAYNGMICDLVQKVVDNKNLSAEAVSYLNYIWDNFAGFASNKKTIAAVMYGKSKFTSRYNKILPMSAGIALALCTADNFKNAFAGRLVGVGAMPKLVSIQGNNFVEKVSYIQKGLSEANGNSNIKVIPNEGGKYRSHSTKITEDIIFACDPACVFGEFDAPIQKKLHVANDNLTTNLQVILNQAKKYGIPSIEISEDTEIPENIVFMCDPAYFTDDFDAASRIEDQFKYVGYKLPQITFWDIGWCKNVKVELVDKEIGIYPFIKGNSPKLFERFACGQMPVLGYVMGALSEYTEIIADYKF